MAFVDFAVEELSEDLRIESSVIAYCELHQGIQRHNRLMQGVERVRLGLQTSPENFFYNAGQWTGAPYVNLNALEFTMLTGTAETGVFEAVDGGSPCTELFRIRGGTWDATANAGAGAYDVITQQLRLAVNLAMLEQVEVREGDTYTMCDSAGDPFETTIKQVHLSLKSSNKPDFTFYQWHPQAKYRFNRQCNMVSDADPGNDGYAVAYMGDNNYVVTQGVMNNIISAVTA